MNYVVKGLKAVAISEWDSLHGQWTLLPYVWRAYDVIKLNSSTNKKEVESGRQPKTKFR